MMKKKKKQLWGMDMISVAEYKRKGHNPCNQSMYWSGSSDGTLVLEFDQLQKLWRIEGMLW